MLALLLLYKIIQDSILYFINNHNVMNISLLISLFAFLVPGPQVPNCYRSYPTARAEASKAQKDMLIFFSSASCDKCDNAWAAFTKDAGAVDKYVSTQVVTDNFDGQILYEHFDPGSVPAWVVLDANGKVKERWQGGWKDAYGKGTLFAEITPTETAKKTEVAATTKPVSSTSTQINTNSTTASKPTSTPSTTSKESVVKTETKTATHEEKTTTKPSTTSTTSTDFIIQAGYFGSETNAQKCVADLKAKGFNQFSIKPLQKNGSTFYQVWSTNFVTEKEAQAKLQQLTAAGLKGTVKSCSGL
jgi:cell division septation protein DedD